MFQEIKQTRVAEVMRTTVHTISGSASLLEAMRTMESLPASSLIVEPVDDRDCFGIITRKDIVGVMLMDEEAGLSYQVAEVMSKPAIWVEPRLSVENCLQMMRMVGARRLPVVDNGKLCGIISNSDIFRLLAARLG